jgi:hypothetical protein
LKTLFRDDKIEFLCSPEDYGVIPAPFPSGKEIPNWFKALPPKIAPGFRQSTIKRCMPFLDSMLAGYIIPLAADIHFKTNSDCSHITWKYEFSKIMVESHNKEQISSTKSPNPVDPKPPIKFMNYWMIKVPKDYSLLFVQPLNRPESRFTLFSGIVDAPYAQYEYVNFPGVFNTPDFDDIIPAGTPLMQVIPIKKKNLLSLKAIRAMNAEDIENNRKLRAQRLVHESLYKDFIHKK